MKRGTILLTIGLAIVALMVLAVYYMQTVSLVPVLVGLAGLVVAGVGASQRWERAKQ